MKTAAEYFEQLVSDYEADTGAVLDRERDMVLVPAFAAVADRHGALDEGIQATREQLDPSKATGTDLDGICALVGVYREQATASTAIVTLSGTPGTVIPSGALVEGGGVDGRARWLLIDPVVIEGGGTVAGEVEAAVPGLVEAGAGEISKVVGVVSGWSGVTNAAAAVPGQEIESDQTLRARRQRALQGGSSSVNAIRGALEALPDVQAAIVLENDTNADLVLSGITLTPHALAVVVYPEQDTTAKKEALALALYVASAAGIKLLGTELATVTGADGRAKNVRWRNAIADAVPVAAALTLAPGYTLGLVSEAVQIAIEEYFGALRVGDVVRQLRLCAAVASASAGIEGASVTVNGAPADYNPGPLARAVIDGDVVVT
jgi:hypothetical protein